MLRASLPPMRSSTTSVRVDADCANAESKSHRGATRPIEQAVTPPPTNVRREIFMESLSDKLVFGCAHDEARKARNLGVELSFASMPRRSRSGVDIRNELIAHSRRQRGGRERLEHRRHQSFGRLRRGPEPLDEVEVLIAAQRLREVHPREQSTGR